MKILFVINCLNYGGAEKNLRLVANYLLEQGNFVQVCSLNYRPTTIAFNNSVDVIDLPVRKGFFLSLLFFKFFELRRIVKKECPDAIISFLGYSNLLNVLIGKSTHVPCIISERADPYLKSSRWIVNQITKFFQWIYTFADGAVFQTPMARDYFAKRLRKKSIVISNPVVVPENKFIHNYGNAKKRIAFVGRFELKQKRQDIALKAFQKVLEFHPDYVLSFYGDGEDEDKVRMMVKKMGLEKSVIFNSVSKNVLADISVAELFLLSSDYEGIPNCLIEAMSIGLPCVSTDCSPGGARMLIEHNKNGLLVPCGDVQGLARAMCFYIENPSVAKQHGLNALKIREKYSMEKIMGSWEKYIYSICKKAYE